MSLCIAVLGFALSLRFAVCRFAQYEDYKNAGQSDNIIVFSLYLDRFPKFFM
jgi:hypothetical protein